MGSSLRFHRAYIEITNICGLECSFCPIKTKPKMTMGLKFFKDVLTQILPYTKEIALHIMGDPLSVSNLWDYLDIAQKLEFKVVITTSGAYLHNHKNLFHDCVKQINISLNSFNKNSMKISFDEYMDEVLELCDKRENDEIFINLRLWNLDANRSEQIYNQRIFERLSTYFHIKFSNNLILNPPKSVRLTKKFLLHFDSYFEWPSLKTQNRTDGYCHGLISQIGVLADGSVVPCCLDEKGAINLGNLHTKKLSAILDSMRATNIIEGFKNSRATEELCQKCTYKNRFNNRKS